MFTRSKNLFWVPGRSGSKKYAQMNRGTSARQLNHDRMKEQAFEKATTDIPVASREIPASEMKKIINGSVITWEGTYQRKPIRVRIFSEPT